MVVPDATRYGGGTQRQADRRMSGRIHPPRLGVRRTSNDVASCRKVTAEAAGKRYAKTSTAGLGAGRHEKSLSCKPGACGDDRSACNGGGLAVQGATSASGGVLRLVRRLRRPQRRRD